MFRWKATAAVAAVAALALAGCSGTSDSSSDGSTLTFVAVSSPNTLDASAAEWGNLSAYYQAVYDTLLRKDGDGTVEPGLATEWTYNDDNTVLTLTIRDDVDFTDGTHLTADIVKQNLERFQNGTSPDAGYLSSIASIDAPDDTTVVITLSQPDPALVDYLTRDPGLVASPSTFDAEDAATNPVGSGPYLLDTASTVTGTTYVYTKNEDYWDPEIQHYDKLVINVISDQTAAVNAIKAGEANAVKLSGNDAIDEVEASGWTINSNELDVAGLLLFDRGGTQTEALGDVRVRQAINYAIDREGLLDALEDGHGTVTTQMFPESSAGYDESLDSYYSYDPAKAKELLAEAGYADGLTLEMPSASALGADTYTLIAQQLADVGITVQNTEVAVTNFIADLLAPKYSSSYMTLEQNPDWQLIQFMISPDSSWNPYDYDDPKVDELIETIRTGDEATQDAAVKELNTYLVEQAWFAPFYRVQGNIATDADTEVTMSNSNTIPNIWDFQPKA